MKGRRFQIGNQVYRKRSSLNQFEVLFQSFRMEVARNVITGLWKVNDDTTIALMSLFYRNLWEKKQAPAVALRNAQLAMLNNPDVIGDEDKLATLTIRGLDFANPQKIDPEAIPQPKFKHTSIDLWAALSQSRPTK